MPPQSAGPGICPGFGRNRKRLGFIGAVFINTPHRRAFCRTFCQAGFIGAVFINKKTAGLLPGGFLALETKLSFFGSLFGGFFSGCFFNNGFFCHFFNNSFFNCCFF